jgi:hypothetical protein
MSWKKHLKLEWQIIYPWNEDEEEYGVIEHENEYSAPIFIDTSILNSKVVLMLLTNSFLFKHAQTFCHHNPFIFFA